MDNILLAILGSIGFIILWTKIFGLRRAIKLQVLGDIIITVGLIILAQGTYGGIVLATLTGLFTSIGFWFLTLIK